MVHDLPCMTTPVWLSPAMEPLGPLPLSKLLSDSVYYPASGFDGRPIRHLAGNYHSFVYVDYGVDRAEVVAQLTTFRGYAPLALRDVREAELTPNGWNPLPLRPEDGDPRRAEGWVRPPFALWAILGRSPDFGPEHGPERFSLLYVAGDGAATFQALYHGNRAAPAVVAVIRSGTGFGGNWTDFREQGRIFARSVLENPAGVPRYLLCEGWDERGSPRRSYWPSYPSRVADLDPVLRLWGKAGGG